MTAIERIFQFIDYKGISVSEFSKTIQVSNGYLAKQKSASANIGSHIIEKIVIAYPELSTDWIITGRGNMTHNLKEVNVQNKNAHIDAHLNAHLSEKNAKEPDKKEDFPSQQYTGTNDIIMNLVEQLKERSEEIGALRQEILMLKSRLAQCADSADAGCVPA